MLTELAMVGGKQDMKILSLATGLMQNRKITGLKKRFLGIDSDGVHNRYRRVLKPNR